MNTSAAIKAIINNAKVKQGDLAQVLGVGSVQAVSNKFRLNRWTASELVSIAEFTGCKLAFILPSGEQVLISGDPVQAVPEGFSGSEAAGGVTLSNSRE